MSRGGSVRRHVAARYLRATKRPDPSRGWRVSATGGMPVTRVAFFGDCSFREMAQAHTPFTPPGFPRALAELLEERGRELVFSWRFVPRPDELPASREDLRAAVRFEGSPDVVLIQTGAICAFPLFALPASPVALRMRVQIGLALGSRVRLAYRLLPGWWIRRYGKPSAPPQDPTRLDAFIDLVRAEWPDATVLVLSPFAPGPRAIIRRPALDQVAEETREAAARRGVPFVELRAVTEGLTDADRCANGYNLAPEGHDAVARVIDQHLRAAEAPLAGAATLPR